MNEADIVAQVRTAAEPLLAARELELVELACRPGPRPVVQLLIHAPGGVSLEQCAELNRALSAVLDREQQLAASYVLEVASPGLDRALSTRRDFERVAGEAVTVHLREPWDGARQLVGRVVSADDASVTLATKRWGTVTLPLRQIAKALLKLPW